MVLAVIWFSQLEKSVLSEKSGYVFSMCMHTLTPDAVFIRNSITKDGF